MRRPRQVIPDAIARRPHASCAPATATTRIPAGAAPLDPNPDATRRITALSVHSLYAEPGQPQDPRTIAPRSHASSLVGSTTRGNGTGWSGAKWALRRPGRRADRPLHVRSAQAAGYYLRSLYSKSVNSPLFWQALSSNCRWYLCSIVTSSSARESGTSAEARHGPRRDQGPVR